MIEKPHNDGPPRARRAAAPAPRTPAPAAVDREPDPVTDWLLERDDLDGAEFSVLFAVHKLRSRPGRAGWIDDDELRRSTGLGPVELGGVLSELRRRGLLGRVRHPVKTGGARYLLIVGAGPAQGRQARRQ